MSVHYLIKDSEDVMQQLDKRPEFKRLQMPRPSEQIVHTEQIKPSVIHTTNHTSTHRILFDAIVEKHTDWALSQAEVALR